MSGADLSNKYDAVMADVIAVAVSCSQEDWTTNCPSEQRSVGVMFDHIAQVNADVVRWINEFLSGRRVELTREALTQRNADHAQRAAVRPREDTLADLKTSSGRTSEFLRSLTDEQLAVMQEWGFAGAQNVGWVAGVGLSHPAAHLKNIRAALGRSLP